MINVHTSGPLSVNSHIYKRKVDSDGFILFLQTLHPLLEVSSVEDVDDKQSNVAFIGLSNWALDPAKMNRGIMVCREDPSEDELIITAKYVNNNNVNSSNMY